MSEDYPLGEYAEFHNYTETEVRNINRETYDVFNLWNAMGAEITSQSIPAPLHTAPSLLHFLIVSLEQTQPIAALVPHMLEPMTQETSEAVDEVMVKIVAFGDFLFRFGQYCANRGLLYSNLTQCNCGKVTDDAIKAFLGESGGA